MTKGVRHPLFFGALLLLAACGGGSDEHGRSWSRPSRVRELPGGGTFRALDMDAEGNALYAWCRPDGTTFEEDPTDDTPPIPNCQMMSSLYEPGAGWSAPSPIESAASPMTISQQPWLHFDEHGNAMLVWAKLEHFRWFRIFASRYVPNSGWDAPVLLGRTYDGWAEPSIVLRISGGAGGHVHVLWENMLEFAGPDSSGYAVRAASYTPGIGWSAPVVMGWALGSMATDARGAATLLIGGYERGNKNRVLGSRYEPGAGWSGFSILPHDEGDYFRPFFDTSVDVDANGDVTALSEQILEWPTPNVYWLNRRAPSDAAWSAPEQAPEPQFARYLEHSRVLPDGKLVLLWRAQDPNDSTRQRFVTMIRDPSGAWSPEQPMLDTFFNSTWIRQIAFNGQGQLFCAFARSPYAMKRTSLWLGQDDLGSGWQKNLLLTDELPNESSNNGNVLMASSRGGPALILWSQLGPEPEPELWASHYE